MTKYVLPALTYAYGALEALDEARQKGDFSRIAAVEEALAFNLSGHVLHSLFWKNLAPNGGGTPTGKLATQIDRDFGGFNGFEQQLTKATATCMGSGWG